MCSVLPTRHSVGTPTVGCATYLSITSGPPDIVAQMLLGYGVFQALLMLRLLPWIVRQPFAPSYWAFTFGLSAITTSFLRFAERGRARAHFGGRALRLYCGKCCDWRHCHRHFVAAPAGPPAPASARATASTPATSPSGPIE